VLLLIQLFHDLNCQDLPPFFEDRLGDFMGDAGTGKEGWLKKYLTWDRAELRGDVSRLTSHKALQLMRQDDDALPGPLQKIRAAICEIAELFALRYLDAFPQLGSFVDGIWNMLTAVSRAPREDLVSRKGRTVPVEITDQDSSCRKVCASCRWSSRWATTGACLPILQRCVCSARRLSCQTSPSEVGQLSLAEPRIADLQNKRKRCSRTTPANTSGGTWSQRVVSQLLK
jgi:hypothetical protein